MARGLEWVFSLIDQMSGPATAILSAVERLSTALHNLDAASEKAAKGMLSARRGAGIMASHMAAATNMANDLAAALEKVSATSSSAGNVAKKTSKAASAGKSEEAATSPAVKKAEAEAKKAEASAQRSFKEQLKIEEKFFKAQQVIDQTVKKAKAKSDKETQAAQDRAMKNTAKWRADMARLVERSGKGYNSSDMLKYDRALQQIAGSLNRVKSIRALEALKTPPNGLLDGLRKGQYSLKMPISSEGFSSFVSTAFHTFSLVRMAFDTLKNALNVPLTVGKFAVDAAGFKETSLAALDTVLSTEDMAKFGPAEKIYHKLTDLAENLRMPIQDVERSVVSFLSAGFTLSETPIALQGLTDLASLANTSPAEVFGRMNLALSQIKGKTKLEAQDLRQIIEQTAQVGVGTKDIYGAVAKNAGMSMEELQASLEDGSKVDSQLAVYSIFDAIKTRLGGKEQELGALTKKLGNTIPRLFALLENRPFSMFRDIGDTKGMLAFRDALSNVVDLTSLQTVEGKKLKAQIESLGSGAMESIFGSLSGPEGKAKIQGIFTKGIEAVKGFIRIASGIGEVLGNAFDRVFPIVENLFFTLYNIWPLIVSFANGFIDGFTPLLTIITYLSDILVWLGFIAGDSTAVNEIFGTLGETLGFLASIMAVLAIYNAIAFSPIYLVVGAFVIILWLAQKIVEAIKSLGIKEVLNNTWAGIKTGYGLWGNMDAALAENNGAYDNRQESAVRANIPMGFDAQDATGVYGDGYDQFYDNGIMSATGFADGLDSMSGTVNYAGQAVGDEAYSGLVDYVEVESPSKLFKRVGQYVTEGFTEGVGNDDTGVSTSLSDMMTTETGKAAAGAAGGNGGNTYNVQIIIKEAVKDFNVFLTQLSEELPTAFANMVEGHLAEIGEG